MGKKKRKYFSFEWNTIIVCPSQWLVDKVKESYLKEYQVKLFQMQSILKFLDLKIKILFVRNMGFPLKRKLYYFWQLI